MESVILNLIKRINSVNVIPQIFQRRNSPQYKFVSYINNSIASYLSENSNGAVIFIIRAYKEMDELIQKNYIHEEQRMYFMLCSEYINEIAMFYMDGKLIDELYVEKLKEIDVDRLLK
jgi:hypothetical protein